MAHIARVRWTILTWSRPHYCLSRIPQDPSDLGGNRIDRSGAFISHQITSTIVGSLNTHNRSSRIDANATEHDLPTPFMQRNILASTTHMFSKRCCTQRGGVQLPQASRHLHELRVEHVRCVTQDAARPHARIILSRRLMQLR